MATIVADNSFLFFKYARFICIKRSITKKRVTLKIELQKTYVYVYESHSGIKGVLCDQTKTTSQKLASKTLRWTPCSKVETL